MDLDNLVDYACFRSNDVIIRLPLQIIFWCLIFLILIYCFKILKFLRRNLENNNDNEKTILLKALLKRTFNYPLIIIVSFSFSSIQRLFQTIFLKEILSNETYALINLILILFTGMYTNIRAFLFFLVFGCQSNVKIELKKIYENIISSSLFKIFNKKNNMENSNDIKIDIDYREKGNVNDTL